MGVSVEDESEVPEWMVMDEKDEAEWLSEKASGYASWEFVFGIDEIQMTRKI